MKIKIITGLKYFVLMVLCMSVLSCKRIFDFEPQNALSAGQAYRNVYDADAAVLGIYGKFLRLAERYVVLNELRGDLMDVTTNANMYLRQINTHTETPDNPYVNPLPFYEVIMNCNDVLHNLQIMRQENRLTVDEYQQRYSDIGAIRCWVYLQLGIHWGEVPYVTEPIGNVDDIKDQSKFARIPFDQLLDKLVAFGESLPYKDQYPAGSSLQTTYDSYNMNKIYIFKKTILGDINLWKGNWAKAAGYYNSVMNAADVLFPSRDNDQFFETYRIGYSTSINGAKWSTIFQEPFNERYSNYENIWVMPFDKNFAPKNPFIDMFSVSGSYLFKPSFKAIQNWENEESNTNTRVGDTFRKEGSYRETIGGKNEIVKYLGKYSSGSPFETTGKWILYRAAILHLRMAEAANRDNRSSLAYGLVNNGIRPAFDDPTDLRAASTKRSRNVTYIQQSAEVGSPYYLDAREGDNPVWRGPLTRNVGIRARVSLNNIVIDSAKYFDMNTPVVITKTNDVITNIKYKPITDQAGLTLFTENMIIKEAAEECAFEGYRWGDLLRIALRRNDTNYLASRVAAKFPVGSADYNQVMSRLSDRANWYLPFKW